MMSSLLDIDFVKQKVASVIEQIKQLQLSEFPYDEPKVALSLLAAIYKTDLARLNSLDPKIDPQIRQQACSHANARISRYYEVLGFILRSTNVRNAFEIYDPLLNLSRKVYGSDAKLIVSSEWKFSPFTYPAVTDDLPNLMFIGLPSTETANSLILPLAGHELGHSVWRKKNGKSPSLAGLNLKLQERLVLAYENHWIHFQKIFNVANPTSDLLSDLFLREIWTKSYSLAFRQLEELFCDLLGLRLFGESYLYAFLYLIAPNVGDRASHYPKLASRVGVLLDASTKFGTTPPDNFASYFLDPPKSLGKEEEFVLQMADISSDSMKMELIDAVDQLVKSSGLASPTDTERDRIVRQFCALSPATGIQSIGDIVNAGWAVRLDWTLWSGFRFSESVRLDVLNDLVFKTMEVMEFESKAGGSPNA